MELSALYEDLVRSFLEYNVHMEKTDIGYSIEYKLETENVIFKILQDFYHAVGYNLLLLNQSGKCSICLETHHDDGILLNDLKTCINGYIAQIDYSSLLEQEIKKSLELFKRSLRYPGNFGIGVKNLADV